MILVLYKSSFITVTLLSVIILLLFFSIEKLKKKIKNTKQLKVILTRNKNSRETARNAQLIIDMSDQQTMIRDPNNFSAPPKQFSFDHCYWSHDGYTEDKTGYLLPNDSKYADQVKDKTEIQFAVVFTYYNCACGYNK